MGIIVKSSIAVSLIAGSVLGICIVVARARSGIGEVEVHGSTPNDQSVVEQKAVELAVAKAMVDLDLVRSGLGKQSEELSVRKALRDGGVARAEAAALERHMRTDLAAWIVRQRPLASLAWHVDLNGDKSNLSDTQFASLEALGESLEEAVRPLREVLQACVYKQRRAIVMSGMALERGASAHDAATARKARSLMASRSSRGAPITIDEAIDLIESGEVSVTSFVDGCFHVDGKLYYGGALESVALPSSYAQAAQVAFEQQIDVLFSWFESRGFVTNSSALSSVLARFEGMSARELAGFF